MKSVVSLVGTETFRRIRIGIGKPEYDLAEYVLSKPSEQDAKRFCEVFSSVADAIATYIRDDDFDALMRTVNTKE